MKFMFDKPACQNIRRGLRKEWLLTNGLGDYASGTVPGCNTRKYHGLLVANLASPPGRHILLSTLEESVLGGGREFFFSCRKHPGVYYPTGHEYLEYVETGEWPLFHYRIGPLAFTRELVLLRSRTMLLVRYTVDCLDLEADEDPPALTLRVKPLLAFRNAHALTCANMDLQVSTYPVSGPAPGFSIRPYNALPPLFMQVEGAYSQFLPGPDWCRNVDYFQEEERGYDFREDLFMPGMFDISLPPGSSILLSASTDEEPGSLADLWEAETQRRQVLGSKSYSLTGQLRREGSRFLTHQPDARDRGEGTPVVVAGYHWFDVWGRDAFIALPGLTFAADRTPKGREILDAATASMRGGLIPNMFGAGDRPGAFNSVDASLWYVWAVQQLLIWSPDSADFVHERCWPAMKKIIDAYRGGVTSDEGAVLARVDDEGMLHSGDENTQFTWMDAFANGRPVTPRYGCAVELNALWYNALAFSDHLAQLYGERRRRCSTLLRRLRAAFRKRFWVPRGDGYLADVWRDGVQDTAIRPNQIFAVSLPYCPLEPDDWAAVVECVRNNLLTPYGLRTLSPHDRAYREICQGPQTRRDAAYHQGTVWPWLLGAYGEALLKTAWDVDGAADALLDVLTPLFTDHLVDAGLGSISEIFDGNPPHTPGGCIAQAWSVAECYRLLRLLRQAAPAVYAHWEKERLLPRLASLGVKAEAQEATPCAC